MPSIEREASRDSERRLIHKHSSSSDHGRALIPMWDSSDPERAPPPLPLNPTSPKVSSNRPAPSSAIATAHAALTEKARENGYSTSPSPKRIESPERSLRKEFSHKRMKSLGNPSVREMSSLLESGNLLPAPKSPQKDSSPSTPTKSRSSWIESKSPEKTLSESNTPITSSNDTPTMKSSQRKPPQSILGENTPPQSATMLALQSMPSRETESPLANVTNGSNGALIRSAQQIPQHIPQIETISSQILSLTNIATNLQREMNNLSRRSKDNATDLLSLKEATNTRDEDIRKALKDLLSGIGDPSRQGTPTLYGGPQTLLLDNKPHNGSPGSVRNKTFSLPRIPTPNSFAASLERETLVGTPSSQMADNSVSVALLEKVVRDMGTKEGQDLLLDRLSAVSSRMVTEEASTAKKLDEVLEAVKKNLASEALVARNESAEKARQFSFDESPKLGELDFERARIGPMVNRVEHLLAQSSKTGRRASETGRSIESNDDTLRAIKSLKDSVAQGGGLTAEVKALVRELRGEVLGMGRNLGRQLEDASKNNADYSEDGKVERARIERIAVEGLEEIKVHMEQAVKQYSHETSALIHNAVNMPEIYNAVRAALTEMHARDPALRKDDVIQAVKEAWETYKPDIEVQHFGLEREELLGCLQQGMREYTQQHAPRYPTGATREEVFKAVIEGLKHFKAPQPVIAEPTMQREEILTAVRECLEEFEFPVAPSSLSGRELEISREDMVEAVKEGLSSFEFPLSDTSRDIAEKQISKEDVLEAVVQGLNSFDFPTPESSRDLVERAVTREEILDAVREGLHGFDFPTPETAEGSISRDDLLEAVREGLAGYEFPVSDGSRSLVERSLSRDDIFEVVQRCIEVHLPSSAGLSEGQIMDRLDEVVETLKKEFNAVSEEAKQNVAAHGRDTEQVLDATKDGFEKLRADIETYVDRAAEIGGNDDTIDMIKREFSRLHENMSNSIVPAGLGADKEEILSALETGLETLRSELDRPRNNSDDTIDIIKSEFSRLYENMSTSLMPSGLGTDKEEILAALREGLDSLRAEMDRPRDGSESILSGTSEILDALYDGLNGLKTDVEKMSSKPVDMTVNYEILDTLKSGLESIRNDIDQLREKTEDSREVAPINDSAVIPAVDSLKRNDIEHLETLITQVQIKVESMETPTVPESDTSGVSKDDLGSLEDLIRGLQATVAELAAKQTAAPAFDEFPIKREDFEAIETLLCNTKAKIDEMDPEQTAKKEHLDAIELLIRESRDTLNEVRAQADESSRREDFGNVESLVKEVLVSVDEIKENSKKDEEDAEKISKTDIEAVEAVCHDIKSHIETMVLTDLATLSSKDDVKNLEELVKEFKDQVETHAETNSKAFEERQAEIVGVSERITEVKTFMDEFKEAVQAKLEDGSTNFETLGKLLDGVSEKVNKNENVSDEVKELVELVKAEFEKSNAGVVGAKLETDESFQKTWDKIDEKVDERFNELMTKYDDAQLAAETKNEATEKRELEIEAAILNSKSLSEELKLLIDTLGSTLTDSVEKIDEASKTVFHRVEETFTKVEELQNDSKSGHQSAKEQIDRSLDVIEEIRGNVSENHPKILDAIKDLLEIVGQHYEHSKSASDTLTEKISGIPASIPPLLPEPPAPVPEKDDSPIHEKLDKLVAHIDIAGRSFEQLAVLDQMKAQLMATSSEVSEFVSSQTKLIKADEEDKERAAADAAKALEASNRKRDDIEAEISNLRDEEAALKESIAQLKAEKEQAIADAKAEKEAVLAELRDEREQLKAEMLADKAQFRADRQAERDEFLTMMRDERKQLMVEMKEEQDQHSRQKMRLAADLSSLETALHIRREELLTMEARAETLERRILDGVIDHSRALLMTKSSKGRDAMNLKRVPSQASSTVPSTLASNLSSTKARTRSSLGTQSPLSAAMSRPPAPKNAPQANSARRILSLNQITHNVPTGGSVTSNFKRSHSVRTPGGNGPLRKSSWGGSLRKDYGQLNKENLELALKETEEESDANDVDGDNRDDVSDTATLRRTSLGTTVMTGTESYISTEYSGGMGTELGSEVTSSELTGSELTGSELSTDFASEYTASESGLTPGEEDDENRMVLYGAHSDLAEVA